MGPFNPASADAQSQALLARLRAFCFPAGDEAARPVRGVRTTQKGVIRMSPEARWIPFTAEESIDATHSSFRWVARLHSGKLASPTVTDAYEDGHGRLTVRIAGVPVRKLAGPDIDKGELQRYLASIVFCPSVLLNHSSLECVALAAPRKGLLVLRLRDRQDPAGAAVDLDISEEGRPLACRAHRPRSVGKQSILTPWSAKYAEFGERDGLRIASQLEVSWHLPEGEFTYFRGEIASFSALR